MKSVLAPTRAVHQKEMAFLLEPVCSLDANAALEVPKSSAADRLNAAVADFEETANEWANLFGGFADLLRTVNESPAAIQHIGNALAGKSGRKAVAHA
ncbi:hypothetical protein [Anatilimnocola aggregata]|nr:hypothetical protein [Anatilimnocola aggregata]